MHTVDTKKLEAQVYDALATIYDPEIPVNIVELGLVYDVSVTKDGGVMILMTLTAPNCPEAEGIPVEVETKVGNMPEVTHAKAMITFDPPWNQDMMSEAAKLELGMF